MHRPNVSLLQNKKKIRVSVDATSSAPMGPIQCKWNHASISKQKMLLSKECQPLLLSSSLSHRHSKLSLESTHLYFYQHSCYGWEWFISNNRQMRNEFHPPYYTCMPTIQQFQTPHTATVIYVPCCYCWPKYFFNGLLCFPSTNVCLAYIQIDVFKRCRLKEIFSMLKDLYTQCFD